MTRYQKFKEEAIWRIADYNDNLQRRFYDLATMYFKMGASYTKEFKDYETKAFLNIKATEARRNLIYSIMINTVLN